MAENKRLSDAEKQRIAEMRRAEKEAAQRQAELEYAEDYRRKLKRDRKRAEAAAREEREAREAEAREARAREIAAQLEEDRREAAAREERNRALLNKVIGSRDTPAREDSPITETAEEASASPADTASNSLSEEELLSEGAAETEAANIIRIETETEKQSGDAGGRIMLDITDDRILLNITESGAVVGGADHMTSGVRIHEISPSEMLEREGTALSVKHNITVSTEDTDTPEESVTEEKIEIIDAVNPEYDDPITSNYPEVAAIKLLGRSITAKSTFRKYINKSKSEIKSFNKRISDYEKELEGEEIAMDSHAAALVNILGAIGAIVEIRCDNLRIVARFGQRRYIPQIKKALTAEIGRYNDKTYEFFSATGERLTRLSADLVDRICAGTGAEVIPSLTYKEKYIEAADADGTSAAASFTLNIGGSGSPVPEIQPVKGEKRGHVYSVTPVRAAVTASELLLGDAVCDKASYKKYLKTARRAERKINKEISELRSGIIKAERRQDDLDKKLNKRRISLDNMLSTMNHGIDVIRGKRDKSLDALERESERCEDIEKKLELNRTYIEAESKNANIVIGCLALEREKLLIAFNTLAAARETGAVKLISRAKNDLYAAMARYNEAIDRSSKHADIEITPVTAELGEAVLGGKNEIKIPEIALLRELTETIGEDSRVVGGRTVKRTANAYTLNIKAEPSLPKRGRRRSDNTPIRTMHGHFFMGGAAPGNIAGEAFDDSTIAAAAVASSAVSGDGNPAAAMGAAVAVAAALDGGMGSGEAYTGVEKQHKPNKSHRELKAEKKAQMKALKAEKRAKMEAHKAEKTAEREAIRADRMAVGADREITEHALETKADKKARAAAQRAEKRAEAEALKAEKRAETEALKAEKKAAAQKASRLSEPELTEEITPEEESVNTEPEVIEEILPEEPVNTEPEVIEEITPVEEPVNTEPEATEEITPVEEPVNTEPEVIEEITPEEEPVYAEPEATEEPFTEEEPVHAESDVPDELSSVDGDAAEPAVYEEAPISESSPRMARRRVIDDLGEESFVEEPCPEKLVDDESGNGISEPIIYEDPGDGSLSDGASDASGEDSDINAGEAGEEDSDKKKIKLRQLPPPEGTDGDEEELKLVTDDDAIYPDNIPGREYIDDDEFNSGDSSKIPSVIEIEDSMDETGSDVLMKPTKRGLRKHLRFVNKKIRRAAKERNKLLSDKKKADGIAAKARIYVSILGVQKKIIDWYINAETSCCDLGATRQARRIARALRYELKRYNRFVREYEKLTGDRLTEASLEIPALILEGEDYQTIPRVKIREFAAPEEGIVYGDGVTESADYVTDTASNVVMTERALNKKLNEDSREIAKLHGELENKVKEKHGAWGIDKTVATVECFGIQKKIVDILAEDLRAACQVSSVKKMQSLKREISEEVKQYNSLVKEYKTVSGNDLTPASEDIAQDIIAGNLYVPIPRVGCVYMSEDEDLNAELQAMSRNSYSVEDDSFGIGGIAFRTKVTSQANKDLALMTKRADYQISMLESERDMLLYRYGKEGAEAKREKREITKRINHLRAHHKNALKYESNDNRRYYAVVTANPYTMDLKNKRADRNRVAAVRSKIINLLNERDILNGKLTALYTGAEGVIGFSSANQEWRKVKSKAALKSKKKYKKLANMIKSMPITTSEKSKVYHLINAKIDAESTVAMLKKRLHSGRLHKEDRLCAKRDIKAQKMKIRALDRSIESHMKSIRERLADSQAITFWYIAFVVTLIIAIVGIAAYIYFMAPFISSIL